MEKIYDYEIYTDGGCRVNPGGAGAYAAVIIDGKTGKVLHKLCGDEPSTTNNRMEMMAAIIGLKAVPADTKLKIYSDSQYLIKSMLGYYQRYKNLDLWKILDELVKDKKIDWKWVRGHDGNQYNEMCDEMCTKAQDKYYGDRIDYINPILNYIEQYGKINNSEVRNLLGFDSSKASNKLGKMVKQELIFKHGHGINTYYDFVKD